MDTLTDEKEPKAADERRSAKLSIENDEAVEAMAFTRGKSKFDILNDDIVTPWRLQNAGAIKRVLRNKEASNPQHSTLTKK